ncbi:MAG: tetratricopeptide repeat protein [Dehalococcoidia bacterium]
MVQAPRTSRRHRIDLAINHALERRWDLAAEANRALLEEDETDVESANRLGKALTELGDVKRAIEAYEQALRIEPTNAIARKNLARLEEQRKTKRTVKAAKPAAKGRAKAAPSGPRRIDVASESLRSSPLIEEHGKSADLPLQRVNVDTAADMSAGDEAVLEPTNSGVVVKTSDGAVLGTIEPRIGLRLKRMMEGGNRYSVVVRRAEGDRVVVHVRETFKHPSLVGQASFLPPASDPRRRVAPRAYTKTSVVRYERGDDYDEEEEDEDWSSDEDGGDDFEDSAELGEELGEDSSFDDDSSDDDGDDDDD